MQEGAQIKEHKYPRAVKRWWQKDKLWGPSLEMEVFWYFILGQRTESWGTQKETDAVAEVVVTISFSINGSGNNSQFFNEG